MKRYWISWLQPGEDYRPMTYPPPKFILGWWCSGYDSDDNSTLCALVLAVSEKHAKNAVRNKKCWPDAGEWRFCEERGKDWVPGNRFPRSDWMIDRLGERPDPKTWVKR